MAGVLAEPSHAQAKKDQHSVLAIRPLFMRPFSLATGPARFLAV
jgi:hypothetical protein